MSGQAVDPENLQGPRVAVNEKAANGREETSPGLAAFGGGHRDRLRRTPNRSNR